MESQILLSLEVKIVEDIEKQMVRRFHWDGKDPGTKAAAVPNLAPGTGVSGCCRSIGG